MKRMVENSEKIEEIADAVENSGTDLTFNKKVNLDYGFSSNDYSYFDGNVEVNGKLTTQNITTPGGISFNLIDEEDYIITDSGANIFISTINLGVALVVSAGIAVSESNGDYSIIRFNTNNINNLGVIQISGAPVCVVSRHINDNTVSIKFTLNKNKAEYAVTDYYRFSFVIGYIGQ